MGPKNVVFDEGQGKVSRRKRTLLMLVTKRPLTDYCRDHICKGTLVEKQRRDMEITRTRLPESHQF